jgi:hypothetical protein
VKRHKRLLSCTGRSLPLLAPDPPSVVFLPVDVDISAKSESLLGRTAVAERRKEGAAQREVEKNNSA